jgi:hypothetical protein
VVLLEVGAGQRLAGQQRLEVDARAVALPPGRPDGGAADRSGEDQVRPDLQVDGERAVPLPELDAEEPAFAAPVAHQLRRLEAVRLTPGRGEEGDGEDEGDSHRP